MSDRIEKEPEESELLVSLQKDSIPVVRGDWKVHLSSELQEGESHEGIHRRSKVHSSISGCETPKRPWYYGMCLGTLSKNRANFMLRNQCLSRKLDHKNNFD